MNFNGKNIVECLQPCGYVMIMGVLNTLKPYKTKNGDLMCFATLSDETATIDLVIMPNLYKSYADKLRKGLLLKVQGKVDKENSCLVNKIEILDIKE